MSKDTAVLVRFIVSEHKVHEATIEQLVNCKLAG